MRSGVLIAVLLAVLSGCGGLATRPVSGKVVSLMAGPAVLGSNLPPGH